jgi:putative sigma-54 modulation protein
LLFTITGKHTEVPESVKEYTQQKTSKLQRYYNSLNQIEVIFDSSQAGNVKVEIIARAEHSKVFVVTQTGKDIYRCIDAAAHKLEMQIKKKKTKERDNKRSSG